MKKKITYPTATQEEILDALRNMQEGANVKTLANYLLLRSHEMKPLYATLDKMLEKGVITCTDGIYRVNKAAQYIKGVVQAHPDGFGFLIRDDGEDDIFLPENEMIKAMPQDCVSVKIVDYDKRGRAIGTIVSIDKRAHSHVVGRVFEKKGKFFIAPKDKKISQSFEVNEKTPQVKENLVVNAKITHYPNDKGQTRVNVEEVIGKIGDPNIEIDIAVRQFGVPHEFSEAAINQAKALPEDAIFNAQENRVDLRDLPLITIDGEDARDFDDAVYCVPEQVNKTNGYRLIVAIADVSYYVTPGSALDHDALQRATSVYFPRRVIPMLPEKLSNGLCSLNPHVDRFVMVCDALIDDKGEVSAYQFYPGIMRSAKRMTYTKVYDMILHPQGDIAKEHAHIADNIANLYALFKVLEKKRIERGAIDFEATETEIISNDKGQVTAIKPRERNDAHKLIEECMLVANCCAADFIHRNQRCALYRVHDKPDVKKVENLKGYLLLLGIPFKAGLEPKPADFAKVMEQLHKRVDGEVLQLAILRTMRQAIYTPDNVGHFGLAYDAYMHFTSPIRRYPDLLTHRVIRAILNHQNYVPRINPKELNTEMSASMRRSFNVKSSQRPIQEESVHRAWLQLGIHCSLNERRADEASQDVVAWAKCSFMKNKEGQQFIGTITNVTNNGLFVTLDDYYVDGMIHITMIDWDYYDYHEIGHELVGEVSGKKFKLGMKLNVQIEHVDVERRRISLSLVQKDNKQKKQKSRKK